MQKDEKRRYLTIAEVKDMLDEYRESHTLNPIQNLVLAHSTLFTKLDSINTQKLINKLMTLDFMTEIMAVKIADIMPTHVDEIRMLFAKERILTEEEMKKVVTIVDEYRK